MQRSVDVVERMKHQSAVYHDTYYSFNLSTKEETQVVVPLSGY